jgi:hypothetical protein
VKGLDTINVGGKDIKAAVTDGCALLTVIEIPEHEADSILLEHLTPEQMADDHLPQRVRHGAGLDVKEHDSFTAAVKYLLDKSEVISGDWDRIYIVNPERLRYRDNKKGKS